MQAIVRTGLLQDGTLAAQDEAAGLAVAVLDPQPGERILDACAAPGGKTIYSAQRMQRSSADSARLDTQHSGMVLATDVSSQRLKLVEQAACAAGVQHLVRTAAGDLRRVATDR